MPIGLLFPGHRKPVVPQNNRADGLKIMFFLGGGLVWCFFLRRKEAVVTFLLKVRLCLQSICNCYCANTTTVVVLLAQQTLQAMKY